ncbi:hypothetical protein AGMMS49975_17960 [Clostridia bacterium]|nr:hypothetical protein AGMMS49975_17960 [Clostridia bacterium]
MPRKKDPIMFIIYAVVIVTILYVALGFGVAMDISADEKGKIDYDRLNVDSAMKDTSKMFSSLLDKKSNSRTTVPATAFAVFLFIMYDMTNRKRTHRYGVEHGSAQWGTDAEKKRLEDRQVKRRKTKKLKKIVRDETDKIEKEKIKKPKIKHAADNVITLKTWKEENGEPIKIKTDYNMILAKGMKMSINQRVHGYNVNTLIVGSAGSGKTRFELKPNLLQLNTSYVFTDPKGEILQSSGRLLEEAGYDVRVFNLVAMKNSHNYNPFEYIYEDGEVSAGLVVKMINVFLSNTKDEKSTGGDQFWEDSAKTLLTACAFLLIEEGDKEKCNLEGISHVINLIEVDMQDNKAKSPFDTRFENLNAKFETEHKKSMAFSYYTQFKKAAPETAMSIVMSCNVRLQQFNVPEIADLTHTDTIHLETVGDKKTALFVVIPAGDKVFSPLSAMMFTQLFDCLFYRANNTYKANGKRLPVHVRCFLDEFANIGQIPHFEMVLSTVRSAEISMVIILQSLSQLKELYEKGWEGIKANCNSFVFLGGQEDSTLEAISKMLGKETIDTRTNNRTRGAKNNSTSENNAILGRELMTPDEVCRLETTKFIVKIGGLAFLCKKYDVVSHPNYRFLEDYDEKNMYDVSTLKTLKKPDTADNSEDTAEVAENIREKTKEVLKSVLENKKKLVKDEDGEIVLESEPFDYVDDVWGEEPKIPQKHFDDKQPIFGNTLTPTPETVGRMVLREDIQSEYDKEVVDEKIGTIFLMAKTEIGETDGYEDVDDYKESDDGNDFC